MSCVGHFVFTLGQWSAILPYQIPCWLLPTLLDHKSHGFLGNALGQLSVLV